MKTKLTKDELKPVVVFSGLPWEAQMIKNILENENIEAFLNNEILGTVAPFYSSSGMGSVKVVISNLDYEKAKMIVEEFEKGRNQ
jgi:hypothetical protein